ncbi:hypothetical protein B0O80DRAFT_451981 [Mortierella sp. GBAus27b]|nr:hypothetical protein B0O80DRAFT_451981 [Mortierella sp. GBAus27b]
MIRTRIVDNLAPSSLTVFLCLVLLYRLLTTLGVLILSAFFLPCFAVELSLRSSDFLVPTLVMKAHKDLSPRRRNTCGKAEGRGREGEKGEEMSGTKQNNTVDQTGNRRERICSAAGCQNKRKREQRTEQETRCPFGHATLTGGFRLSQTLRLLLPHLSPNEAIKEQGTNFQ